MAAQAKFEILAQDKTQQAFSSVKRSLSTLENAFGGMKTAIAGMVGAAGLGALIHDSLEFGDHLNALSQRLGASTEALSQYRYAAKLSNIEFETLTQTWETMQRNIGMAAMNTGRAKDFIKHLGLDAKELIKLSPEAQFEKLADALMAIENPAERAAYAFRILGSNGAQMLQLMQGGSAGMKALREEANRLGLTITGDMADKMDRANDEIDKMKLAFSGLGILLATQLAPVILKVGEAFLQSVEWIKAHEEVLVSLAKLLAAGGVVVLGFRGLAIAVSAIEVAFLSASAAVKTLMMAFAAGPIAGLTTTLNGISIAAVAASGALGQLKIAVGVLGAAFMGWQLGSWLQENFAQARIAGLSFVGAILKGWEDLKYAAQVAWLGIAAAWEKTIATMKIAFADFLQGVAKGLSKLPFGDNAASGLSQYAENLKASAQSMGDFSSKLETLSQQHEQAKTTIDDNITSLVAYELNTKEATTATTEHTQAINYTGLALGEMGKQHKEVNKLLKEAKQLTEDLRTPMEVYQENLNKIDQMLQKGYITQETYQRAMGKFQKDYEDSSGITEALKKQQQEAEAQVNQIQGVIQNGLFAFMDEGFDGMVKSFSNALKAMAAEAASKELGKLFMGSMGNTSGGGSYSLLNQFLGNGLGTLFGFGGFRAGGGSVNTGQSYVVGEKEPELFTPTTNGFITPLSQLQPQSASHTTVVIHNHIQTPDLQSFQRSQGNLTARMKMQMDRAAKRNL